MLLRSFIRPRKKRLLDNMTAMWLAFIVLIAAGLIIFGILLHYKSSFYIKMLEELHQKNGAAVQKVEKLQKKIALITMQNKLYHEVTNANTALKESIRNMFDLIPDQITLTKVVMEKKSLYLKGYTNTPESYTLLLEPPLKSIFTQTKVKFSRDEQGRTIFESYNTVADMTPDTLKKDENASE